LLASPTTSKCPRPYPTPMPGLPSPTNTTKVIFARLMRARQSRNECSVSGRKYSRVANPPYSAVVAVCGKPQLHTLSKSPNPHHRPGSQHYHQSPAESWSLTPDLWVACPEHAGSGIDMQVQAADAGMSLSQCVDLLVDCHEGLQARCDDGDYACVCGMDCRLISGRMSIVPPMVG
jgi:hypothetical protein